MQMRNRLEELREAHGLSRADLAALVEVSYETVWRWEKGEMAISTPSLVKIARHLRITPADIVPELHQVPAAVFCGES